MARSHSLATIAAATLLSFTAMVHAQQDPSKDATEKAESPLIRIQAVLAEAGNLDDEELQAACARVHAETIQASKGEERPGIYTLNSRDITRFLAAVEKQRQVKVLSRPSLLAVDGQVAEITIGGQIAQAAATRITAEGKAEVVAEDTNVGLTVAVVPTIAANAETKLELCVKKSALSGKAIPAKATDNKQVLAAVVESSRAQTVVQTPDGKAILVAIKGEPSKKWFEPTKTTLILLTPRIVADRTAAAAEILHH